MPHLSLPLFLVEAPLGDASRLPPLFPSAPPPFPGIRGQAFFLRLDTVRDPNFSSPPAFPIWTIFLLPTIEFPRSDPASPPPAP